LKKTTYIKISAEEAKKILDSNEPHILLDVRNYDEYLTARIKGAILIPVSEIDEKAELELLNKDIIILVYCRSGARSKEASQKLIKLGYSNVFDIGGILE